MYTRKFDPIGINELGKRWERVDDVSDVTLFKGRSIACQFWQLRLGTRQLLTLPMSAS